jgi:hypothetical protein
MGDGVRAGGTDAVWLQAKDNSVFTETGAKPVWHVQAR